jgi:hypothetical protein
MAHLFAPPGKAAFEVIEICQIHLK